MATGLVLDGKFVGLGWQLAAVELVLEERLLVTLIVVLAWLWIPPLVIVALLAWETRGGR